ncbi:biotin carboxylase [Blastocystis sp. subtype 4]|uniref:biotin carboxylase n=1 Tax=Blastocystis sp. subtype 4 TaxID=944170 RepID=UPI000711F77B|nr:biotin carboxylase [Blastocystis sp. subtype 4]KNB42865.1 biotin carboxylase [Blastocystis sp. subtype 4]|eukprot:XP_014526308.1 biotin carboxylase [Blastocystis sp. subtype 4]
MLRLSKLFIANRGEIASRIIRTAKNLGIKTIAVCNPNDQSSKYIQEADEAICVPSSNNIFLDMESMIRIAKEHNADALHPGYGFLSESPVFSRECEKNGIKFVGPSYETMQLLSSKRDAKELAVRCGIPVIPGYNGGDQSMSRICEEVKQIGYPALLKATMGGGGRGMRIIESETNLEQVITMCMNEAKKHFGDGSLLIEKYLPRTHHIEVQVFGDQHGNYVHFGERECSLQRHYQKIVEEAPCVDFLFYLSSSEKEKLYRWAIELAKASKYEGAGTVEFLCDANSRDFYFMEVNTRLQVEHLVSQCINHQIDLVELQLRIAAGESIQSIGVSSFQPACAAPSSSIYKNGPNCGTYAMECRVYNEDPAKWVCSPYLILVTFFQEMVWFSIMIM